MELSWFEAASYHFDWEIEIETGTSGIQESITATVLEFYWALKSLIYLTYIRLGLGSERCLIAQKSNLRRSPL